MSPAPDSLSENAPAMSVRSPMGTNSEVLSRNAESVRARSGRSSRAESGVLAGALDMDVLSLCMGRAMSV